MDINLCILYSAVINETDFFDKYYRGLFKLNLKYIMSHCKSWKEICNYIQYNKELFDLISEDDILDTLFHIGHWYCSDNANFAQDQLRAFDVQDYFYAMYLRKTNGIKPNFKDLFKHDFYTNSLLRFFE